MVLPKISIEEEKKHVGETVISLKNGKVLAFGKDPMEAFNKAKKVVPDLDQMEFLISRIQPEYLAA